MDLAQPLDVSFTHTNAHLMVSLIPPKGQARAPCKLCCVGMEICPWVALTSV